jgi:hypothetical protein
MHMLTIDLLGTLNLEELERIVIDGSHIDQKHEVELSIDSNQANSPDSIKSDILVGVPAPIPDRARWSTRALRSFQTKESIVGKLFAKHIKLEEAKQFLQRDAYTMK